MATRLTLGFLILASCFSAACSDGVSEREVLARFDEHRAEFEELRSMVQDDAESSGLRFVSAEAARPALCGELGDSQACLSVTRRGDYERRMRRLGVLWIDRERDPARTYFVLYHRVYLMDARLRGLVHASNGITAGRLKPHQAWRSINDGWHSYLMIDS